MFVIDMGGFSILMSSDISVGGISHTTDNIEIPAVHQVTVAPPSIEINAHPIGPRGDHVGLPGV